MNHRLVCALTLLVTTTASFAKSFPKGILDLPGAISATKPIGALTDHPWEIQMWRGCVSEPDG
jgi:hypothetical protein